MGGNDFDDAAIYNQTQPFGRLPVNQNGAIIFRGSEMKQKILIKKANITTRNFHESVAEIRKRTKIKDGGSDYLFFTTDPENQALVLHCVKV